MQEILSDDRAGDVKPRQLWQDAAAQRPQRTGHKDFDSVMALHGCIQPPVDDPGVK
jgi:hypothetical protein